MPRQGLFPSQQFHCLSELITIHINISLCTADMMGILFPAACILLFHFHWKQTSFFAIFEWS